MGLVLSAPWRPQTRWGSCRARLLPTACVPGTLLPCPRCRAALAAQGWGTWGGSLTALPGAFRVPPWPNTQHGSKGPRLGILCPWMSPVLLPVLVASSHMPGAHLHRVLPGSQDFHQRPSPESLHSPHSLPGSLQGSAKLFGASSGKMQGQTGQAATLPLPSRKEGARARAMQCRGSRMSSTPSCPSVFLTVPLPH